MNLNREVLFISRYIYKQKVLTAFITSISFKIIKKDIVAEKNYILKSTIIFNRNIKRAYKIDSVNGQKLKDIKLLLYYY